MDPASGKPRALEEVVDKRMAALRGALNEVAEARRKTHDAHLDTIRRLVLVAEYKDEDTAAHVERVGLFSKLLAKEAGLSPREVEIIQHAAPMHDVGKIGIPDDVLLKQGSIIALTHHELWDGSGYPHGLRGLLPGPSTTPPRLE